MTKPNYIPRAAAAEYLSRRLGRKISVESLEQYARKGDGPPFVLILCRASYTEADLDAWIEQIMQQPTPRKKKVDPIAEDRAEWDEAPRW